MGLDPYVPSTEEDFVVDGQQKNNTENNTENDEDDYLRNPLPLNKHVGVDEEDMYLEMEPKNTAVDALQVVPCTEKEAHSEDGSEDEDDTEEVSDDGDQSEDEEEA